MGANSLGARLVNGYRVITKLIEKYFGQCYLWIEISRKKPDRRFLGQRCRSCCKSIGMVTLLDRSRNQEGIHHEPNTHPKAEFMVCWENGDWDRACGVLGDRCVQVGIVGVDVVWEKERKAKNSGTSPQSFGSSDYQRRFRVLRPPGASFTKFPIKAPLPAPLTQAQDRDIEASSKLRRCAWGHRGRPNLFKCGTNPTSPVSLGRPRPSGALTHENRRNSARNVQLHMAKVVSNWVREAACIGGDQRPIRGMQSRVEFASNREIDALYPPRGLAWQAQS
ncbi:hypothetical protein VNO77_27737 [Canavalia gladiata]|uniref:Uncharacterized protein n=1 Tax=Canavalia gladiata TaxID=3824 RepID=A0AAN9KVU2_CANGL